MVLRDALNAHHEKLCELQKEIAKREASIQTLKEQGTGENKP